MTDLNVRESDPTVLHARLERMWDLARSLGATHEQIKAAILGPLHPDRVNLPAAGRFPVIDPAPYIALMSAEDRFRQNLPQEGDDAKLCGVQITEEASEQIRQSSSNWQGITTCVLPHGHFRGWGEGSRPPHVGILIEEDMPPKFGFTRYQWLGPVRELGQVAPR